jgi:dihydrodipicolinate synthase/N-acetylneuraminate lyase
MAKYEPGEARAWALEQLAGVCGCLLPTLRSDLDGLNETAIRHDVAREIELGFSGVLLVAECGTTPEEMRRFVEIAVDEGGDRLVTVLQASEPTLKDDIELVRFAADAGVDLVLLSYPLTFYPRSEDEIIEFTRSVADASHLGLVLFAMDLWNFGRLHPSGFAPAWMEQLIELSPNVVAIKNEIGDPSMGAMAEVFRRFGERVVVTDPMETNAPGWTSTFGMRWMGTSNYEYMGAEVPRYFELLQNPARFDDAMEIYWRLQPARRANGSVNREALAGSTLIHRPVWKYQGWLMGFNGGPIRSPQMRLNDRQMRLLRAGAEASGLPVTGDDDHRFFEGRYPA